MKARQTKGWISGGWHSHFPWFAQDPGEGNVCLRKRFLLRHGSRAPVGINSSAIRKITTNPSERKLGARFIQFLLLISSRHGSEPELRHLKVPQHETNGKIHPAGQHLIVSQAWPDDQRPSTNSFQAQILINLMQNLLEVIPSRYPSAPLRPSGSLRLSPLPRETQGNDSSSSSETSREWATVSALKPKSF